MDTIKFIKQLDYIPDEFKSDDISVSWQNLTWKRKDYYKYTTQIRNLYIQLRYSELTISNSLHKFYHGNNYTLFTYKELVKAVKELDSYFDFSIYDAKVIKYTPEIIIEASPEETYNTWLEYKSKSILPMVDNKNGKIYGGYVKTGGIKLKGYDKTYEANKKLNKDEKINDSLFRLEAEISTSYARNVYNIGIYTVSDLIDVNNYNKTYDLLFSMYDKIKRDTIDYTRLNPNEYRILGLFKNRALYQKYRKHHPHSYKKDRQKFNNIFKAQTATSNDNIQNELQRSFYAMKAY